MMFKIPKQLMAVALMFVGLCLAVFGNSWGPFLFEPLETTETGTWITLIVPFLPMVFIGSGAALLVSHHRAREA